MRPSEGHPTATWRRGPLTQVRVALGIEADDAGGTRDRWTSDRHKNAALGIVISLAPLMITEWMDGGIAP